MSATTQPAPAVQKAPCPRCHKGVLDCVVTVPFAQGFIIAVRSGSKKIAGCRSCIGKELRKEALLALLVGCFSIPSLIINVVGLIPYNFIRSFFVKPNPVAVSKFFDEIGVPEPGKAYRISDAYYAAAGAMIRADGSIDPREVEAAKRIGARVLEDFDPKKFEAIALARTGFPAIDAIATVFRIYLKVEGQRLILQCLLDIAKADGSFDPKEDRYIEQLATKMGYGKDAYHVLRDAQAAPQPKSA